MFNVIMLSLEILIKARGRGHSDDYFRLLQPIKCIVNIDTLKFHDHGAIILHILK